MQNLNSACLLYLILILIYNNVTLFVKKENKIPLKPPGILGAQDLAFNFNFAIFLIVRVKLGSSVNVCCIIIIFFLQLNGMHSVVWIFIAYDFVIYFFSLVANMVLRVVEFELSFSFVAATIVLLRCC